MFVTARSSSSAYLSHTRPLSLTFISSVFHSFKKRNYALSTASATNPGSGAIHVPVLLDSIIDHLKGAIKRRDGKLMFLDGTFGEGHYTRRLLLEFPQSSVIALDRDPDAIIKRAVPILEEFGHERFRPIHGKFGDAVKLLGNIPILDAFILDVGVSSNQLEDAERGFSFMKDGPLDMRMGEITSSSDMMADQAGREHFDNSITAAEILNNYPELEISRILKEVGEESQHRRIARMIVRRREKEPFSTTVQLANLINGGLKAISENQTKGGRSKGRSSSVSRINPATKTFQALRIYINNELDELRKGVCASERLLKPGGLFAAVSFHSLEDRILKRMIKFASQPALPSSPASGVDEDGGEILLIPPSFTPVTRKPITPSAQEIHSNSRSRSAKLRLALRTDSPAALLENFDRMLHEKEDEY